MLGPSRLRPLAYASQNTNHRSAHDFTLWEKEQLTIWGTLNPPDSHGSLTHIFAQIKEPDQHFSQMRNRALTRLYSCNGAISSARHLIHDFRIAVCARMFHNFHFQWR